MSLLPGSGPSLSLKRSLSCILARKSEASDWAWSMQQGARMMGKCFQWETWQDKLQLTGTCKDRKGKTYGNRPKRARAHRCPPKLLRSMQRLIQTCSRRKERHIEDGKISKRMRVVWMCTHELRRKYRTYTVSNDSNGMQIEETCGNLKM